MTRCTGFGQIIDTSITVPGAIPTDSAAAAGIAIRMRPEEANNDSPLYAQTDDTLIFSARDVASYHCCADGIEVAPCPAADPQWVTDLLIATALPATLWIQGRFMLHAAGVILPGSDHAIAIAGPSGSGKSILTNELLKQGAQLVGDDSLALDISENAVIASGLAGGIHMRTGQGDERRFEPVGLERSVRSAPLGAIIILSGRAESFQYEAMSKTAAVERILTDQHRPRIPAMLERIGPALVQATAIASQLPVFTWQRRDSQPLLCADEEQALSTITQQF